MVPVGDGIVKAEFHAVVFADLGELFKTRMSVKEIRGKGLFNYKRFYMFIVQL